jgi:hypothetical protein
MKQLLNDFTPFRISKQAMLESIKENGGRLIVSGILQRANAKNQNSRIYPKAILERELKNYSSVQIAQKRALGELDHPDSMVVNLSNASHNIMEIKWEGDNVVGKVEILNTPSGKILKELFEAGITLGISSRGMGSIKQIDESTVEVQDDYNLIAFDFVSEPSTQGAFLQPMNESKNYNGMITKSKYSNVSNIVTDIIMAYNTK